MDKAASYNDTVVRQFALMVVVWGIVGMLVGVLIAAQLIWPALNYDLPFLTYSLSLIHISEPTRPELVSRMPSSA